ncbi:MAG: 2-oxoisovalerate dehydrogenase [Candidatus Omnitrophota bacterium]
MIDKEIIFVVEEDPEGGYNARALSEPIFTQADQIEQLHERVRDAVRCHFEEGQEPKIVHLHYVREEIIAL